MSLRPTFMGFETMRRAIGAAQKSLDITGSNLANVDTVGYSRQRLDLFTVETPGGGLRYQTSVSLSGQGVNGKGVTQIRDPFLDARYRDYNASTALSGTQVEVLSSIEDIIGFSDTSGVTEAYEKLVASLQAMSVNAPNRPELSSMALQSALQLVQIIKGNDYKLDALQKQTVEAMDAGTQRVSEIFKQIANLNGQITNSYVASGDFTYSDSGFKANPVYGPNELKDQRNVLLDELSNYGNVKYTNNENGSINVNFANNEVVNDTSYSKLTSSYDNNGSVTLTLKGPSGTSVLQPEVWSLDKGTLRAHMNMINGAGSYKSDQLLLLQNSVNEANSVLENIERMNKELVGLNNADPQEPAKIEDVQLRLDEFIQNTNTSFKSKYNVEFEAAQNADGTYDVNISGETVLSSDGSATPPEFTFTPISISMDKTTGNLEVKIGTEVIDFNATDSPLTSDLGIPYYRKTVDALANTLANAFNQAASTVGTDIDPILAEDGSYLKHLFEPNHRDTVITAANFKISEQWMANPDMIIKPIQFFPDTITIGGGSTVELKSPSNGGATASDIAVVNATLNKISTENARMAGITDQTSPDYIATKTRLEEHMETLVKHGDFSYVSETDGTFTVSVKAKDGTDVNVVTGDQPENFTASDTGNYKIGTNTNEELANNEIHRLLAVSEKTLSFGIDPHGWTGKTTDFTGKIGGYFKFVQTTQLAQQLEFQKDVCKADNLLATQEANRRDGVMAVNMDEEGSNMMSFQKWYNASARMMTTLDEALDTIINGMGKVGR